MGTPSALASRLAAPYFASAIPRRSQLRIVVSVTPALTASLNYERPAFLRSRLISFISVSSQTSNPLCVNPFTQKEVIKSKRPVNRRKGAISLKAVLRTRAAVK